MKFRFKALERQRHPDQLDSPLLLASPQGWVAVFTVLITTVMIGLWAFLGSLPRSISVDGMVSYSGGVESVEAALARSVPRPGVGARPGVGRGGGVGPLPPRRLAPGRTCFSGSSGGPPGADRRGAPPARAPGTQPSG